MARRLKLPFFMGQDIIKIGLSITGRMYHLFKNGDDIGRFWKTGDVWLLDIQGGVKKFKTLTELLLWVDGKNS